MTIFLPIAVLVPTAAVVAVLSIVLWRTHISRDDRRVALFATFGLAIWSTLSATLSYLGFFRPRAVNSVPPIGLFLAGALLLVTFFLTASPSLRRVLTDQANLTRLHLWRLEGAVFLLLLAVGRGTTTLGFAGRNR